MIVKLLMLGIWMVLVPVGMGYFALRVGRIRKVYEGSGKVKDTGTLGFSLCLGYILMWAFFQVIAVPLVLKRESFWQVERIFEAASLTFAIAGVILFVLHLKNGLWESFLSQGRETLKRMKSRTGVFVLLLWGIFAVCLLFQVIQAYRLAYADGDDAYYLPISVAANLGGRMYAVDPYTGASTSMDMRHGLAPFPIWVSFIASKCGVNAAVAAHSLIPLVLLPVTYVLYLEIGKLLCRNVLPGKESKERADKRVLLPVFMIFVALLQIFGNYSIYPPSTFLLTRTRQGKAALGNVILPFFLLLLYQVAEEVKVQGKAGVRNVLWLMAAMTAGCLCSTMAGFLCGMLVMLTVTLLFVLYRRPHILWQGLLGCVPGVVYALLYLRMK